MAVKSRRIVPWAVLFSTIAATLVAGYLAMLFANEIAKARFDAQVGDTVFAIQTRLKAYEQVLAGAKGLFAASNAVDRSEWKRFVDNQSINERFPGIQGVGYIERVKLEDLQAHIKMVQSEGYRIIR